ncbi:phage portal protein [Metabacillus sp. 22489]|uniref:phage portal protein n=1 Tax=Metabacillus sp. 22489 TaxID=3453928 RepID=UPI003F839010
MLTPEQIKVAYQKYLNELPRNQKLYNYYIGVHDILNRVIDDPMKPNNKIVTGYPTQIIDTLVAFFASVPLSYLSKSDNEEFLKVLSKIFYENDEEDVNAEIVKNFSIFGKTYELYWISDKADEHIRFTEYSPLEMYVERDSKENVKLAIRPFQEVVGEKTILKIEAYDDEGIYYFTSEDDGANFILDTSEGIRDHYFGETPVNVYKNCNEEVGDFERFIPMIDAIDKLLSDSSNELEAWVNAYLVLAGHGATEGEDVLKLREDGILLVDEINQAKFLTKDANTDFQQQFFETVDNLIHDQSATPKLTSEQFSSNLSGQALGFKLFGIESRAKLKERKMKKALRKRIKFICNILNKPKYKYDPMDIEFDFIRNIPQDHDKIVDQMTKLVNMVDLKTLLSWHPKITDVELVLKRLSEQNDSMDLDKIKEKVKKEELVNE